MKLCLNNPSIECTGKPIPMSTLTYENVKQPDSSTKRIWHKHLECALSYPSCGTWKYAQLSLPIE